MVSRTRPLSSAALDVLHHLLFCVLVMQYISAAEASGLVLRTIGVHACALESSSLSVHTTCSSLVQ